MATFRKPFPSKRINRLLSLTRAILPIFCSDVLWKLPTTYECAHLLGALLEKNTSRVDTFLGSEMPIIPTSLINKSEFINRCDEINLGSSHISTDALVANGMLQACLLDIITVVSFILEENFSVFIPTLLYPLLSKLSDINCPLVRRTTLSAIDSISNSGGYRSSEDMLSHHFAYLMEVMTTELKCPSNGENELFSHHYCFYSLHSTIKYVIDYDSRLRVEPRSIETRILLLVDMLSSLGRWFNGNFKKNTDGLLRSVVVVNGMLQLYCSTFMQLNLLLMQPESKEDSFLEEDHFRWESLLVEFQLDEDVGVTDFGIPKIPSHIKEIKPDVSWSTLRKLIECTDSILMINSLLVSISDLRTQVDALALFKEIFELLAAIQRMVKVRK